MITLKRRTELVAIRLTQPGQSVQVSRPMQAVHQSLAGIRAVAVPVEQVPPLPVFTQHNAAVNSEGGGYTQQGVPLFNTPVVYNEPNTGNWFYLALPVGSGWVFELEINNAPVVMQNRGVWQIAQAPGRWFRVWRYQVPANAQLELTVSVAPLLPNSDGPGLYNAEVWGRLFVTHRGQSATMELRRSDIGVSPELSYARDDNTPGASMLALGWLVDGAGDNLSVVYRDDIDKNFGWPTNKAYDVLVELVWVLRNPAVDLLGANERAKLYNWFRSLNRDQELVTDVNKLLNEIPDQRPWMQ